MAEPEYKNVVVDIPEDQRVYDDVHLSVNGVKLDLPNLNSTDLPIELVQMILIMKSKTVLSDEESALAMSTFLAYFQSIKPNFWNALRRTNNAMEYLVGTAKAWAEQSGIDPKAFSSLNSGTNAPKPSNMISQPAAASFGIR